MREVIVPRVKARRLKLPGSASRESGDGNGGHSSILIRAALVGLVALAVALGALFWVYNASHEGRVYGGVRVLGAELGGRDRAEAELALRNVSAGYPRKGVTVEGGEKTWNLTPADLGLSLDNAKTIDKAMQVGRGGGLSSLGTMFRATEVAPVSAYDPAKVDASIARIASELDRPAVDSKLERGTDGTFIVTASAPGSAVDGAALREDIIFAITNGTSAPVAVSMQEITPKVVEAALKSSEAQARLVTGQALTLKAGKSVWSVEPSELRDMIATVQQPGGSWGVTLDDAGLTEYLLPVAEKLKVEPVDAGVEFGKNSVSLREEEAGQELDVPVAIAAIKGAALSEDEEGRVVSLPLKVVPAAVHTEQVRPVFAKVEGLVKQGLRLYYGDDGYIIRNASVIGFIDVVPAQGGPGPLKLVIDEEALANRISGVAYNFNRPPADARFRMVGGTPKRISAGRTGLKVDVGESLRRALAAIDGYSGGDRLPVELVVAVTQPTTSDADIEDIRTPDLLGTGQTSYAGSSPERAHNVELGASKINGALIPPGGVFSTNDTVGELTLDAGFEMGYMIINNGGDIKTVPAEAGGICQVSTTLFHAVFWSGLEVVERNWHSYWIASYGRAPSGLQGLDSTIAPPDKDFRFKNNTANWLLIRASASKGTVTFKLYGVDPGWKVDVGDPVISDKVKTDPEPIREETDKLPAGKEVKVETAQDGFSSSITRTVLDRDGNVVDKWTAKSRYAPARNRFLIGTGPAVQGGGEKKP